MRKKIKIGFRAALIFFVIISIIFSAGCKKKDKDEADFVRGPDGLVMSFIDNAPQDKYVISDVDEPISIAIDVWNKGTHPRKYDDEEDMEAAYFNTGRISISGFDKKIIVMEKDYKYFSDGVYLPPASPLNPRGGLYTAEFNGKIKADNIIVDKYEPTILVTACYPYSTIATPTVCVDPQPFETRQEKVCTIGSQTLKPQGAPIAITKIDQEASRGKIRFKITIENVGKGDVIWENDVNQLSLIIDKCSPAGDTIGITTGRLDRKDFDKVRLDEVKIGEVNLLDPNGDGKFDDNECAPFAEGTDNIIRLFDGSGFVVCTLDELEKGPESAYTTPIAIKLSYAYRSTISKPISIRKIE